MYVILKISIVIIWHQGRPIGVVTLRHILIATDGVKNRINPSINQFEKKKPLPCCVSMCKLIISLGTPHILTCNFENLLQLTRSLLKYLFPCIQVRCIQNKCCWGKNRHLLNHYEYLPLYCLHSVLTLSVLYHAGLIFFGWLHVPQTNECYCGDVTNDRPTIAL